MVTGLGTWELANGRLSLGGLMLFLALPSRLYGPIRGMSGLGNTFYSSSSAADRITELLDQRPQVVETRTPRPLGRARGGTCDSATLRSAAEEGRPVCRKLVSAAAVAATDP
ncbi:hypothetical protein [Kitasatospora aureofaciens]|uniref:hypothetical protein n=1 Tax=Kitasatospora aureofaciens TaxID=1894 RepID=UPI0036F4A019